MKRKQMLLDADEDDDILPTSIEGIIGALTRRGCADLTSSIDLTTCSDYPHAGGGFCEVYQGTLYSGARIAVKSLKVYGSQLERDSEGSKVIKRAAKELYHWSKLNHPNVLPLMGLAIFKGFISIISGWMVNGDLTSYLKQNPDADRIRLCTDICAGLCYIHAGGMVHGDLKGANIMISPDGIAMIADFGNARWKDLTLKFGDTTSRGLSNRWAAPELLLEDGVPQVSMEADVYAYGMTALEALTGKVPYEELSERRVTLLVAFEKQTPPRPSGIPDSLWELLISCWARDPSERPKITSVGDRLGALFPPSPAKENSDYDKGIGDIAPRTTAGLYADEEVRIYCTCNRVTFGEMIPCDNVDCPFEWFHLSCVGIAMPSPMEKWYCELCRKSLAQDRNTNSISVGTQPSRRGRGRSKSVGGAKRGSQAAR